MAAVAMQIPLQGYGQSILRTPKYNKTTKIVQQEKKPPDTRSIKSPPTADPFPLRKVGAFGVSVKRNPLIAADYSDYERTKPPLDDVIEEKEAESKEEETEVKHLPPVEISIRKKIKRRIMLRHAANAQLALSDRQLIEDLRQDLRNPNKAPDGAKSVLEAMGDPKIRESRFYHEPLGKFLAGNLKQQVGKGQLRAPFLKHAHGYALNTFAYPSDIKLVNVSVPPSQQHFNTPVDPRQVVSTTQTYRSPRGGAKHGHPGFPKVVNPHRFDIKVETRESAKASHGNGATAEPRHLSLSPYNGKANDNEVGRKTDFSLPSISLHAHPERDESRFDDNILTKLGGNAEKARKNTRKEHTRPSENAAKRNAKAMRQRMGRPPPPTRQGVNGYSGGIKTTATGKSHLIGPMNKMDMIVEYSKLLQNKVINYEQYITKLSKLSLHKIDLGNSGLRHYHIVRDGSTGMKPRLARVDVYPTREAPPNDDSEMYTRQHETTAKGTRRQTERLTMEKTNQRGPSTNGPSRGGIVSSGFGVTPYDYPSPQKHSQLRLSRVSIGEGIPESHFEYYNAGHGAFRDQYLTYDDVIRLQGTDMERYRHAHRPHNADKHGFHWSHLASNKAPYTSAGNRPQNVQRPFDSRGGELYSGHAGKLPSSREMKKRLNFSYPSYDVMVDGTSHVATADNEKSKTSSGATAGQEKQIDEIHDPDYLAITLDKPNEKASSVERANVASSLSVHDVTIPTDVTTLITAGITQKNGTYRKGLTLGLKDPKTRDASSSPVKSNFETLNITPVAITTSNVITPNPASSKSPYYVSQDDFATSGTDGVLQTHLNTIYKSIYKAKAQKDSGNAPNMVPGKNSPPNVLIKRLDNPNKPPSVENDDEVTMKVVLDNAKLLQAHKRLPKTPPPRPSADTTLLQGLVVPTMKPHEQETQLLMTSSAVGPLLTVDGSNMTQHVMTSPAKGDLLPNARHQSNDSPPPTALLLQTREDEVTSTDSDVSNDANDTKPTVGNVTRSSSPEKLSNNEIRLLTSSVELNKNGGTAKDAVTSQGEKPHLEVVITSLPAAPPSSEAESSDEEQ